MDNLLVVSYPPHIHSKVRINYALIIISLCLLPSLIMGVLYFGLYSLMIVVVSILSSIIIDLIIQYAREGNLSHPDMTAILTGLLLGMALPPHAPLWIPLFGSGFAIIFVKQMFGGFGLNFLNPAISARLFLQFTFPSVMFTAWSAPIKRTLSGLDTITQATPLTILKNPGYYGNPSYLLKEFGSLYYLKTLLLGQIGGTIGETCKITLIIGGLILIITKIVDFRIVGGYIISFLVINLITPGSINPLFQLLTGGVLLGIFFMATDWVTSPLTKNGRFLFGIGCGILTFIFRRYSGYPEGVTPAILLMNISTPLIDKIFINKRRH